MSRHPYEPAYYENKLEVQTGKSYHILPITKWRGLRTRVNILCDKHNTKREVNLQKIFNGKNSTWPCRQCYLDGISVKVPEECSNCTEVCRERGCPSDCKCRDAKGVPLELEELENAITQHVVSNGLEPSW